MIHDMCVHPEKSSKIPHLQSAPSPGTCPHPHCSCPPGQCPRIFSTPLIASSPLVFRVWFVWSGIAMAHEIPWSSTRSMRCIFSQPRSAPGKLNHKRVHLGTSYGPMQHETNSVFRTMFLENPGDCLWLVPEPRGPMWFVLCAAFPCSPSAHEESRQKSSCDPIWSNMIQYDAIWCMICMICMMQCMMQWHLTFWSNLLAAGSWKLDRKQDLTLEDEELVCRRGVWDPCWLWLRPQAEFPGISCKCTCFFVISSEKLWFHVMSIHFQDSRW